MPTPKIPKQSQVIPARVRAGEADAIRTARPARGLRGAASRRPKLIAGAVLSALLLASSGFLAGVAVGNGGGANGGIIPASLSSSLDLGSISADDVAGYRDAGSSDGAGAGDAEGAAEAATGEDGIAGVTGEAGADDAADGTGETSDGADESGATAGSSRRGRVLRGDVLEIDGEQVLVCATGNGYGISHIGTTLRPGATPEETRADSDRLCATAYKVVGGLLLSGSGDKGSLLREERSVSVAGTSAECRPSGEPSEKTLRCEADDESLVTVWSVAPETS